jgi:hypothetical protein
MVPTSQALLVKSGEYIRYIFSCGMSEYKSLLGFPKICKKSTPQKAKCDISRGQKLDIVITIMVITSISSCAHG